MNEQKRGWLYLRMSSKSQDGSIEQQRAEWHKRAEKEGISFIREYVDEGKSGSKDQEKRVAFHQMLSDAKQLQEGDIDFVCVWDSSRFGRMDTIDSAFGKQILRDKNICLFSLKEGIIDWNTFTGRIQDSIFSELNNLYSQRLAADSLRGRVSLLEAGFWPNGSAPYGYDRQYISPSGETRLVKRNENFSKPSKSWLLRLVVNDEEAEVVRFIFDEWVNKDQSVSQIAEKLNVKKIASPVSVNGGTGEHWTEVQVWYIIDNPAYMGVGYIGSGRGRKKAKFANAGNLSRAGVCPVIIHPAQWEAAQQKRTRTRKTKRRKSAHNTALAGCVVCGHCGQRMHASHWKGRAKFVCNSGRCKKSPSECKQWSMYEDELLPLVCVKIVQAVDEEVLKAIQAKPEKAPLSDLEHLLEEMRAKEAQAQKASQRYLTAPDEIQPMLLEQLKKLQTELASMKERYTMRANQNNQGAVKHFVDWWREVRERLVVSGDKMMLDGKQVKTVNATSKESEYIYLRDGEDGILTTPDALRSLLNRLGVSVAVYFAERGGKAKETPGRGRGPSFALSRARVFLKTGNLNTCDTSDSASTGQSVSNNYQILLNHEITMDFAA